MPNYQIKILPQNSQSKKRPSIQFAPSLEKPVYIVTKNMNGHHIIRLTQEFDRNKISYQMQQQTSTLGYQLNQRFFVIVDNNYGQVTLGAQFGSILMTIVGFPRIGNNKKNKYFQKPSDVVAFYKQFKEGNDISNREKSLIKSQYSEIKLQKEDNSSKINSQISNGKIKVKSFSKHSNIQGIQSKPSQLLKDGTNKLKKLIIVEDKSEPIYNKLCEDLLSKSNQGSIQKEQSIEVIRKKTLFHTNKANIYYLVNEMNEQALLKSIFIGEVIIFHTKNNQISLSFIANQPKVHAITSQTQQVWKIIEKIGINLEKKQLQITASNVKKQQITPIAPQVILNNELSKLEAVQSKISNPDFELNASVLSKASSKDKKIKRLKPKSKIKDPNQNQYYQKVDKQNNQPILVKGESSIAKKTLKTQENNLQAQTKSKKSLKFKDDYETQQIKRVKSVIKCEPITVNIQTTHQATMTESQYMISKRQSLKSGSNFFNNSVLKNSSKISYGFQKPNNINAIFYREFIPKFYNIVQLIKIKPTVLFFENHKSDIYQPFLNIREYDRAARKIKNKLKQNGYTSDEFNFIVFLLDQEINQFEKYCRQKSNSYEQESYQLESTFKNSNFSSISMRTSRINIFAFILAQRQLTCKTINYGKIKLTKHRMPKFLEDANLTKTLQQIRSKILQEKDLQASSYFHS